jgi:uncharacterized RmlC-like cupin family protein
MTQSHIAGGTTPDWHLHGEQHTSSYVVKGIEAIEYGSEGEGTPEVKLENSSIFRPGRSIVA